MGIQAQYGEDNGVKKDFPVEAPAQSFKYEVETLRGFQHSSYVTASTSVKGVLVEDLLPFECVIYEEKGSFSWRRKRKWATQILRVLVAVHAEGLAMGVVNYAQFGMCSSKDKPRAFTIEQLLRAASKPDYGTE